MTNLKINDKWQMINGKSALKAGVSFIEILVVIAIFAVLGVLVGRITLVTLRGSNRSESLIKVRENLDYSLAVMERQIRNAESVSPCPNPDSTRVDYVNTEGKASSFSCQNVPAAGYVASGSGRLTSDEVKITACSLVCTPTTSGNVQPSVTISLEATSANFTGVEAAKVTASTKIFLRTY